jgi:hypothetical protein
MSSVAVKPMDNLERHIMVLEHRSAFYVGFKSGSVRRWAAKMLGVGKEHDTLTTTLWRHSGAKAAPTGARLVTSAGSNYYFNNVDDAYAAATEFLNNLQSKKGVSL